MTVRAALLAAAGFCVLACKVGPSTRLASDGDGLGSPCQSTMDAILNGRAAAGRSGSIADLSEQFPAVKEQRVGDCWVYAAVAGVEAAVNRGRGADGTRFALADEMAAARLYFGRDTFANLKDRMVYRVYDADWIAQNVDDGGVFEMDQVVSGGFPEQIAKFMIANPAGLLLQQEFSANGANLFWNTFRARFEADLGSSAVTFRSVVDRIRQAGLISMSTAVQWLAPYTSRVLTDAFRVRMDTELNRIHTLERGRTTADAGEVDAVAGIGRLKTEHYAVDARSEQVAGQVAALYLEKYRSATGPVPGTDTNTDVVTALRTGTGTTTETDTDTDTDTDANAGTGTGTGGDVNQRLAAAVAQCRDVSRDVQRRLVEDLCKGLPVVVSMRLEGTLWRRSAAGGGAGPTATETATRTETATATATGAPTATESGTDGGTGTDAWSGGEWGMALADDRLDLVPWIPTDRDAEHAYHAMAADGLVLHEGKTLLRFRNSWGAGREMYLPFPDEACRILGAFTVLRDGETGSTAPAGGEGNGDGTATFTDP